MSKAQFLFAVVLVPCCALAQTGVVQINQATVAAGGNRVTGGFPYQITQPGSYQLTGNLVVPANVNGINISSNNVTLDLNGFTISGPAVCTPSNVSFVCTSGGGNGIFSSGANITVRNGSVAGFSYGVSLNGYGNLVEEIHASGNADAGILVSFGVLRRSTANINGNVGIMAVSSTVTENVASVNGGFGLVASSGGVYGSNTFSANGIAPQVNNIGSVSQNNNACDAVAC